MTAAARIENPAKYNGGNLIERRASVLVLLPEDAERMVCARLENLAAQIVISFPQVRTRLFNRHGGSFFLNCYVEFSVSGKEESLIAAINFRNNLGRFVVTADVCGEESGTLVWERPDVEVNPNDIQQVDRALHEATEDLVDHSISSIQEALK